MNEIGKRTGYLTIFMFLFLTFNIDVCAKSDYLTYKIDSVLNGSKIPASMIDDDLRSSFGFYDKKKLYSYKFPKTTISGYFLKQSGMILTSFYNGNGCPGHLTKDTVEKDGGTYFIFQSPVVVDCVKFRADSSSSDHRVYEFEVFQKPYLKVNLASVNTESLRINYKVYLGEVTNYSIYKGDELVDEITTTEYILSDLEPSTKYDIKVKAKLVDGSFLEKVISCETKAIPFSLLNKEPVGKLEPKDAIIFTFSKPVNEFVKKDITTFASYKIDDNKVIINLLNDYGMTVNLNFSVTDFDNQSLEVKEKYLTVKEGEILDFGFEFIVDWFSVLFFMIAKNSKTILLIGLGLLGLIIGVFFLIGLGKKSVKKSK